MSRPVADLHCDLLLYLAGKGKRTAYDSRCRSAIPQLRQGNVHLQTLAIFGDPTDSPSKSGRRQAEIFMQLPEWYPDAFSIIAKKQQLEKLMAHGKIGIVPAIESASVIADEDENLEKGLEWLERFITETAKPIYVGLTWNGENRFGGGVGADVGLKEDGRRLLAFLNGRGIAADLSHASDRLAFDLLHEIDKRGYAIPLIASHSNAREACAHPRNLPDPLIRELARRGGLLGINFVKDFVGRDPDEAFVRHLDHLLEMGMEGHLAFGADFFYDCDIDSLLPNREGERFFPLYGNSGVYPAVLELLKERLQLDEPFLDRIAYGNCLQFLKEKIYA